MYSIHTNDLSVPMVQEPWYLKWSVLGMPSRVMCGNEFDDQKWVVGKVNRFITFCC